MSDRIAGVNRARIEWCCRDQNLSLEELFDQLKIAKRTLEEFLSDEPALTFGQLEDIAKYFGRGVLFFFDKGPVDPTLVHTPQFRTIANQKPLLSPKIRALLERAERQRDIFMAMQEELGEEAWIPWKSRIPEGARRGSLNDRARVVRDWLSLKGVSDFGNYRERVERQGVLVFLSNGYAGSWQIPKESSIRGFSLVHEVHPLILIKKQRFESPQTFTLFHELAHLILHDHSFADDADDLASYQGKEREASALAGLILVPDDFLAQVEVTNIRLDEPAFVDDDLKEFRLNWGVSSEVILRRLMDEERIPKKKYEAYKQWQESNPIPEKPGGGTRYRFSEPLRIFGRPFVSFVLEAVSAGRVTLNKASGYLDNIKVSDIHKLEERCASA